MHFTRVQSVAKFDNCRLYYYYYNDFSIMFDGNSSSFQIVLFHKFFLRFLRGENFSQLISLYMGIPIARDFRAEKLR